MIRTLKQFLSNKSIKAGIWYTIGNYLLRGISFITVPIFARMLTKADYGRYNTFLSYESILYILISLALHSSIKNAKYEFKDKIEDFVSSITLLPIIVMFTMEAVVITLGGIISPLVGLSKIELILLIIYSYGTGLVLLYHNKLALDYKYKEYMGISYFNSLGNVVLSLILITTVFGSTKYLGRIIGGVIPLALVSIYILFRQYRLASPRINRSYYTFALKISVPIIPHGLAQILLLSFDRIMISKIVGDEAAGIYSFAYTLYTIISITANSISTVFEPWAFEQLNAKRYDEMKKRSSQIILFYALLSAAVILLGPEIILILGSAKYVEAIYSVVPIVIAGFFAMSYSIPAVIEYYSKKTEYIAYGTCAAAAINIGLNAVFIPKYGYVAAAYTTLFSYVLYFIFHSVISAKLHGEFIVDRKVLFASLILLSITGIVGLIFLNHMEIRIGLFIMLSVLMIVFVKKSGIFYMKISRGSKNGSESK